VTAPEFGSIAGSSANRQHRRPSGELRTVRDPAACALGEGRVTWTAAARAGIRRLGRASVG
jgi:hypothetical protein